MLLVLSSPGLVINLVWGSWDKILLSHHLLVFLPHKPEHTFSFVDIKCHPYSKYWILGVFFLRRELEGALQLKHIKKSMRSHFVCLWGSGFLPFEKFLVVFSVFQRQIKSKTLILSFKYFAPSSNMTNRGWDLQVLQTLVTGRKTSGPDQETIKASVQKKMK